MIYQPHNWVIIKIHSPKEPDFYKVLGGWSGGYLDGDYWRINSGITRVEEEGDFYLFHGSSGSIYKCHKEGEYTRQNIMGVLMKLQEQGHEVVEVKEVIDELK